MVRYAACARGARSAGRVVGVAFEDARHNITTLPIPEQGLIASFNLHVRNRAGLKATLQDLTDEIRGLMAGKPPETRDPAYPPVDYERELPAQIVGVLDTGVPAARTEG